MATANTSAPRYASSSSASSSSLSGSDALCTAFARKCSSSSGAWIDPASLPEHTCYLSQMKGNAPDYVKQLNYNTYCSYGVGDKDSFGYAVGQSVKFTDVDIDRKREKHGRLEATTVAEVLVTKNMLNGAGMLHGGCVAYLIDNTPLVVLGIVNNVNGVGVTQAMNIVFHSPAPLGTRLKIISTSVALGGRIMTARCEIMNSNSGRVVASAFVNKMQPLPSRM
ncbi:hypothetical protein FISHEDRAFT_38928 [Fistulina hepatica ATCC 64428]|uniref:Thioesterase domain-containing protein n=1 Tax=Fistulina hepatica ATCC 64428 TaxID=1128425 RepID=A0A0D7AGV8_9AGAR|nr:hypothetical protein FISHEDRAFT_38928 [Fistulina hepatica ATCC 64428]